MEVIDAKADEVFERLIHERKALSFAAGRGENGEIQDFDGDDYHLTQPEDDSGAVAGSSPRRADTLPTRLTSEVLQRRLLRLYHDSHTYQEEQGVNVLFLAVGFLKWYDAPTSEQARYAPLLLVPVKLERQSTRSRFKITALEDNIATNLSLKAKLEEFVIKLPDVPEVDSDELSPSDYFDQVRKAVAGQPKWEVLSDDMVLWFFSFTKFLMFRDLQEESWPTDRPISGHDLVSSMLGTGFRTEPPLCGEDEPIDQYFPPEQTTHIVDADSSQAVAIEEVRTGRNLVIQGPPGTGKSQTIANLIATAVKDGKRVLFVAEKLAALEVVKSRLDRCGLGSMCLELHSNKANKKAVLANLAETLELSRPKLGDLNERLEQLRQHRERLNRHAEAMHTPFGASQYTPYFVIGRLTKLMGEETPPPPFRLPAAIQWTDRQFRDKVNVVHEVALHLVNVGVPNQHPWRGVNVSAVLPLDRQRLLESIPAIRSRLERLVQATEQLARLHSYGLFPNASHISTLAKIALHLSQAPDIDVTTVTNDVWDHRRTEIAKLIANGEAYVTLRQKLTGRVEEDAWNTNVSAARKQLSLHGRKWLRWLHAGYRDAVRTLETICIDEPPRDVHDRITLLDELLAGQRTRNLLLEQNAEGSLARQAFGSRWNGVQSNWAGLQAVLNWFQEGDTKKLPATYRHLLASVQSPSDIQRLLKVIVAEFKPLLDALAGLFQQLKLDLTEAFGNGNLHAISLVVIRERLDLWLQHASALEPWIAYRTRWRRLFAEQLDELAHLVSAGRVSAALAVNQFSMAAYEEMMRALYQELPELAEFDGYSHEQAIRRFQQLDQDRIELARKEVALVHYERLPRGATGIGEMGILKNEMQKQRRHMPIRKLLNKAGRAIQAIKPVFMMSPISIAQFLEPGAVEFDLLLVDEASQVRPVDALGAIARSKQVVVVGDDKQLPPTMFFEKMTGNYDEQGDDNDDEPHAGDVESVLGLCLARNMTQRMLRWHYRSRHHSLIAVSNCEFYQNKLFIVPSPQRESANLGLRFHHVPDGVFDRGKTATNRVEARAVAQAVIDHTRHHPELSLGVGAFSVAQRDAIIDELELLRREHPHADQVLSSAPKGEPFFVKNLESLQGDERDVILISVGYARDSSGFFGMSFGPLSSSGGERRLNVLISRARQRCEVFSSITGDDIDLSRAKSRGAAALKTFLKYAQAGILDIGAPSGRECDSEFELEVKRSLEQHGWHVDAQVGVAGFFVDLAIRDPDQPGRYLVGIECDGATYHSSRGARDRDRLRQQVLEDREWVIHRIWSTDWFKDRDEQVRRTLQAIENARMDRPAAADEETAEIFPLAAPDELIEEQRPDEEAGSPQDTDRQFGEIAVPYQEAEPRVRTDEPLHEVPSGGLARVALEVVRVEGPVHREEIIRRIASFWGLKRVSGRTSEAVQRALDIAVRDKLLEARGDFYIVRGQQDIPLRRRDAVTSATLRNADMLPPDEIRKAVMHIVQTHLGAENDELVVVTSRLLGFSTTGPKIRQAIAQVIDQLVLEGSLRRNEDRLFAG